MTEIKEEILKLLTEPAAIHKPIADEDDQKKIDFKNIDKIIDDADARQSSELTDQLWTVLKGLFVITKIFSNLCLRSHC